jgi:hypothetical protein
LEFPIIRESGKYPAVAGGKIKGVSSTAAKRIEGLQPYNAIGNIEDHPLLIIHNLDIIDKHRLLILVGGELKIWSGDFMKWQPGELDKVITHRLTRTPSAHPDADYQVSFDIAFDVFGSRRGEAVIPSLQQLTDFVSGVIDSFSAEFK